MIDTVTREAVLTDGGTIIAATHRLARQICWRHDQSRAAAGALAWPSANALPLDAWLRRTWEAGVFRNTGSRPRRLLSDDESRHLWRRVLANDGRDRLDAGVIVPLVAAGWRLCQAWEISPADLHRAADSDDARAFARWADAYLALLERHAWQDTGGLMAALGRADMESLSPGERRVGFAGFDPWTPALQRLAGALQQAGAVVVDVASPTRTGRRGVVAARNENDEFSRACAWAARYASAATGAGTPANVAIVVPGLENDSSRVRRVGLDVLSPGWQLREPRDRPLALAVGRRLADYALIHCALDLLELIAADVSFGQASQLLRSCYVAGASVERAGRARAELRLRRRPLERVRLTTLLALLDSAGTGRVSGQWQQAEALAVSVRGHRLSPSQWAGHFTAWLAAAGWPGDRGLASEEYQAAEAWQGLLASLAGTDEVVGVLSLRGALGVLAQQVRDRPFEPESVAGAVQVLSLREAEGQDFSALWICGMTADEWPPPARPHALIPVSLQRAAGIPEASNAGIEALTRRRFERLLGSADDVALSWPAEREQAATLPSPLLRQFDTAVTDEASLHPDRMVIAASADPEEALADSPPALPTGQLVPGGSRVLALQAVCPARAFAEFRLRAAPLEAPVRPLDPATRGKVVHRLLEELYRHERCRTGLGGMETDELRRVFAAVVSVIFDELLPAGDSFLDSLRPLESDRLWKLLLSLRELDGQRPGFRVATELERQINIGPLALTVRLDRLDELADGGELVIDYKTGNFAPSGWKQSRVPESQLPLYAVTSGIPGDNPSRGVAVIQIRVPDARLRGVGDEDLKIAGVTAPAKFFQPENLDWDGVLERWRGQLEQLAAEFAAGDFRVNPADRRWATGQFAGLTRIHEFGPAVDDRDGETPDGDKE